MRKSTFDAGVYNGHHETEIMDYVTHLFIPLHSLGVRAIFFDRAFSFRYNRSIVECLGLQVFNLLFGVVVMKKQVVVWFLAVALLFLAGCENKELIQCQQDNIALKTKIEQNHESSVEMITQLVTKASQDQDKIAKIAEQLEVQKAKSQKISQESNDKSNRIGKLKLQVVELNMQLEAAQEKKVGLEPPVVTEKAPEAVADAKLQLCSKCGQIKGTDKCCLEGAVKCSSCSLVKGSPACCKNLDFSKGAVILCGGCGQVKGSEACCAKDAQKCSKCGLAKGSPGCCKITI